MSDKIIIEDVLLDDEELGLADSFVDVESTFTTTISSDDEADPGDIVYFGVDLIIGDIGEVKGKVSACEEIEEDLYRIYIEIQALDSRYAEMLIRTLKGETEYAREGDGVQWATGLKQTNGAMATLINCPAGLLKAEQLAKITEISKQGHGLVKLTHAQRVILLLKPEQLETLEKELEEVDLRVGVLHAGIRNVRGCCGALCQFANDDGLGLALEIDKALFGRPMKFDVKIAVSDCMRNCMESFCVDIGLIADKAKKYNIYVGGSAASVHLKALRLVEDVPVSEVIPLIERILDWYDKNAKEGERVYKTLERIGKPLAAERDTASFAEAGSVFAGLEFGEDVVKKLSRALNRACAVKQMQEDLELP